MKKTTLTILMTFILFASGYAQSNENVFGSTYKLVKGYSKVPSDGIYLIAGYFSEKNGGGSLYLMSSDNLNDGIIEGKLYTKVTIDEPPGHSAYSNMHRSKQEMTHFPLHNFLQKLYPGHPAPEDGSLPRPQYGNSDPD